MLDLCQDVGHRLILNGLSATGVQILIKDKDLSVRQYEAHLTNASQSAMVIAQKALAIFQENHIWRNNIRAVTVRAIDLIPQNTPWQTDMFSDLVRIEKRENIAVAVDGIRQKFGNNAITNASLFLNTKMPDTANINSEMPGLMYQ